VAANVTPQTYYLWAIADRNGQVQENNESNNSAVGSQIAVSGADLLTTAVSGPASVNAGDSISVSATLRNQGSLAAGASNVGIYLSTSGPPTMPTTTSDRSPQAVWPPARSRA